MYSIAVLLKRCFVLRLKCKAPQWTMQIHIFNSWKLYCVPVKKSLSLNINAWLGNDRSDGYATLPITLGGKTNSFLVVLNFFCIVWEDKTTLKRFIFYISCITEPTFSIRDFLPFYLSNLASEYLASSFFKIIKYKNR